MKVCEGAGVARRDVMVPPRSGPVGAEAPQQHLPKSHSSSSNGYVSSGRSAVNYRFRQAGAHEASASSGLPSHYLLRRQSAADF